MSGRVVVLEGLDGVGKTTLAGALAARLGAAQLATPDPALRRERGAFDVLYRSSPDAAHLFYAAAVAHAAAVAAGEARAGRDVVIDRYWLSTCAYGAVRGTRLRLADVEASLLPATLTVLLVMTEERRHERLRGRGMTGADRATLDALTAARVLRHYRRGLRRPIAGHGVEIDVTDASTDTCVDRLSALLAGLDTPTPRRPR